VERIEVDVTVHQPLGTVAKLLLMFCDLRAQATNLLPMFPRPPFSQRLPELQMLPVAPQ
jgi:hypothetical protein